MTRSIRLLIVLACLGLARVVSAAPDVTLFRLFLLDGGVLVSYGEFVRLEDSVVFSMPAGGSADAPRLQPVTIAAALVDWPRTERYADSARYQRYVKSRAEEDYLALANEVAGALNRVALSTDPRQALALAESVRTHVAEWPRAHYGYRAADIGEIVSVLDEAISSLRASTGGNAFELSLVATAGPPPLEPVLGMPSAVEQIDQIFRLATVTPSATERVALYQAVLGLVGDGDPTLSESDAALYRRAAETQIQEERATDLRYLELARHFTVRAVRAAANALVAEIERLLALVSREDERLGSSRPETIQALNASLRSSLADAQHLRLRRDQWALRRASYQQYQRSIGPSLVQLERLAPSLDAIRGLQGPDVEELITLRAQLSGGAEQLQRLRAPEYVQDIHEQLVGAWRFAENAVLARLSAVAQADTTVAWEASSSAAGALMMIARVQHELDLLLRQPTLQ